MRVVAINGSPKKDGNTALALQTVMKELESEGISTELIHIGNKAVRGCLACGRCAETKNGTCAIPDAANEWIAAMFAADGVLLGSPVYYSGINGTMKSFLDRAFCVAGASGRKMRLKVGAAVVAARRSGASTAVDQLNKYFTIAEMLMPCSSYWNIVHGRAPGEAAGDAEGLQIMRVLGRNMAWLMKLVDFGKGHIPPPPMEDRILTSFIR
ncbi:MAG: FMN reductase [Lentisphaerae bacterium RIFOXYB12_FULL_65_16]|nr:MAG: FMN reductase [Lentisphaerae bacterium RIFOXYA12_64_32]OGV87714.1 MAG: FMN reductase [Lentisphaerae bacterium RIFOXYB12_FULL_65_16]